MSRTIVTKRELQNLISESIKTKKSLNNNKVNISKMTESINDSYNLIRIEIIKEGHTHLRLANYRSLSLNEGFNTSGSPSPGVAAGEGLEVVINGIKKSLSMFSKDSESYKALRNSITRLNNTLVVIGSEVASGQRQRRVCNSVLEKSLTPLPFPGVGCSDLTF
tara:strand:- start:11798 stop:12289 length:492 start_codon:yes stop_codon:yes gene_type:complete